MKQNFSRYMLFAALLASPICAFAQFEDDDEEQTEEVAKVEKVHVAFRDVDADKLLGGVSFVNMEELAEKDYTTYSLSDLSGLVSGWNGSSLWGMDAENTDYPNTGYDNTSVMVFVDGIRRPSNNIQQSEIAQVTFLKGAQAVVLYGPKAAKGVILITTKRGENDGLKIKVNANSGFHVAKAFPEYLGSAEYMTLYNEAAANDANGVLGKLPYSQQDIYNHSQSNPEYNPYRYPDINYYSSDYVRKAYNRSEATVEIMGGAERAHFYTNINFYDHQDLLDFGIAKKNNTNRLSVRGNIDLVVNSYITGFANAQATFYNNGYHNRGDFWGAAAKMRPNFPQNAAPLIPLDMIDPNASLAWDIINKSINVIDGKYILGGTKADLQNDIATGYAGGKSKDISRQFMFDAGVNFDLDRFVKGLAFKTTFAIDYATKYSLYYDNKYAVFIPTWSNYNGKDVIVAITQEGDEVHTGSQSWGSATDRQTVSWNGLLNWDRMFGKDHHANAVLVANAFQTTINGQYHRYCNSNLGLQAGYDYKGLYFVDLGLAYDYSARFPKKERGAFSPTVTLGWRFGKEEMFENTILDDAMLSASVSNIKEDMDIVMDNKMFYLSDALWTTGGGYTWNETLNKPGTQSTQGGNPGLTYVQRKEISATLRASLWEKLVSAEFTYFMNKMDGLLVKNPIDFPSHLSSGAVGSFKPVVNRNVNSRRGFDFGVKFQKKLGEVDMALGVNGTYFDTEITKKYDEIYDEEYRYRQGTAIDGIWGLESMGLFQSQEEIDNAPTQNLGSKVKPGDIRYKDQNGDGVIDDKDEVFLAKGGWAGTTLGSPFTLGLNLTLKWKGFTFFALGTGQYGGYSLKNSDYYWVSGDKKYSAVVRDRWTPETARTATYPRLTALGGQNNFRSSDFWLYKTNRFDLSKVQITYDIPKHIFSDIFIEGISVYVSGHDLLTISKERKHMEMNVGSAPQTRFYNLGVKVTI